MTLAPLDLAVDRVIVLGPRSAARTLSGRPMTTPRNNPDGFAADWLRVVVVDAAGKRAWSNPLLLAWRRVRC